MKKKRLLCLVRKIPAAVRRVYYFFFANTIGRLFYSSRYFTGHWFKTWRSLGWEWVTKCFYSQKIIGKNRSTPWPVSNQMIVTNPENIIFDVDDLNNFQSFGSYFQCFRNKIFIGKGTFIAGNVGLITTNHDLYNPALHSEGKDIIIGEKCWIGMNSVVLPGVNLGDHTVVGAGSVVTKSFTDGYCVIAGNPAKKIKEIERQEI